MSTKTSHTLSFSRLPSRISGTRPNDKSVISLRWDRTELKKRILFVLNIVCEEASAMHVEFVDPVEMGALNWQFRGKERATDVLSFIPHAHAQNGDARNLGEIAICADICAEQSVRHKCTLADEVERMLVHGLLHLKGFDHERSAAAHAVMTATEKSLRRELTREFGPAQFCIVTESAKVKRGTGGRGR